MPKTIIIANHYKFLLSQGFFVSNPSF